MKFLFVTCLKFNDHITIQQCKLRVEWYFSTNKPLTLFIQSNNFGMVVVFVWLIYKSFKGKL